MQVTGPGALETVKLSDNQTVQLSLQYSALETLHFVPRTSGTVADIGHESGPHGSAWTHIKGKRSYGLQEAF